MRSAPMIRPRLSVRRSISLVDDARLAERRINKRTRMKRIERNGRRDHFLRPLKSVRRFVEQQQRTASM